MTLGDHVRVTKVFADAFSGGTPDRKWEEEARDASDWKSDGNSTDDDSNPNNAIFSLDPEVRQRREKLAKDLGVRAFPQV